MSFNDPIRAATWVFGPSLFHFNREVVQSFQNPSQNNWRRYPNLAISAVQAVVRGGNFLLGRTSFLSLQPFSASRIDPQAPLVSPPDFLTIPIGIRPFYAEFVSVFSAKSINEILKINHQMSSQPIYGGVAFSRIQYTIGDGLFTFRDEQYKQLRKISVRAFSHHSIKKDPHFVESLNAICKEAVEGLLQQGRVEDLLPDMKRVVFRVAVRFILGSEKNWQEMFETMDRISHLISQSFIPVKLPAVLEPTLQGREEYNYFLRLGEDIKNNPQNYEGAIQSFIEHYDAAMLTSIFLLFLEAAVITTAMALISSVNFLGLHRNLANQLHEECQDEEPSANHLDNLPHLKHFVNEVLRLNPSIPILWREINPDRENADLPFEHPINDGNILLLQLREMMRYGDRGEEFNPDRFSSPVPNYCPFSKGPNDCIGRYLALFIIKGFTYHFVRVAQVVEQSEMKCTAAPLLTLTEPFSCTIRSRQWYSSS